MKLTSANSILNGNCLTLSWRRSLLYRSQSIDFSCKSMDWFLYDRDLRHERVSARLCYLFSKAISTIAFYQAHALRQQNYHASVAFSFTYKSCFSYFIFLILVLFIRLKLCFLHKFSFQVYFNRLQ